MGDIEYITAFQRIVLPIAYEFDPELVLVSAGFDACIGDPIGHYSVSPEAYGYFTHWLSSLANGRIILCLEGGYNVNSISHAMAMCSKALLGDPLPMLQILDKKPNASCIETINKVLSVQKKYWNSLKFNKKLPDFSAEATSDASSSVDQLSKALEGLQCSDSDKLGSSNGGEGSGISGDCSKDHDNFVVESSKTCPHLATLLDSGNTPTCM